MAEQPPKPGNPPPAQGSTPADAGAAWPASGHGRFRSGWSQGGGSPAGGPTEGGAAPASAGFEASQPPAEPLLVEGTTAEQDLPAGLTRQRRPPKPPLPAWVGRTGAALLVLVGAWVLWEAGRTFLADAGSALARQQVQRWVTRTEPPTPDALREARDDLETALGFTPDDAALHEALGDLHSVAALAPFTLAQPDGASRTTAHFAQAKAAYQASLKLRPTWPPVWASLAATHLALNERDESLKAWRRARELGPNEPGVQGALLDLTLLDWAQAAPEQQQWAMTLFEEGDANKRAAINRRAKTFGLEFADE